MSTADGTPRSVRPSVQELADLVARHAPLVEYLVTEICIASSYTGPDEPLRAAGRAAVAEAGARWDAAGRLTFAAHVGPAIRAAAASALASWRAAALADAADGGRLNQGEPLGGPERAETAAEAVLGGKDGTGHLDLTGGWYDDVLSALSALPDPSARLLRLVYVEQRPADRVAADLDISVDEVGPRTAVALQALRASLDGPDAGHGPSRASVTGLRHYGGPALTGRLPAAG